MKTEFNQDYMTYRKNDGSSTSYESLITDANRQLVTDDGMDLMK